MNVSTTDASNPVLNISRAGAICVGRPATCGLERLAFDTLSPAGTPISKTLCLACRPACFYARATPFRLRRQGGESADRASPPPGPTVQSRHETRPAVRADVRLNEVDLGRHGTAHAYGLRAS